MYIPAKAVIPDRVYVVCNRQNIANNTTIDVRLASAHQKTEPKNIVCVANNLFKGPFRLEGVYGTNNSFGGELIAEDIFPFKKQLVVARCWLSDWAVTNLIMSGVINKGGFLDANVEMCAVTYGSHYTLVIKDGDIYNRIPKQS